MANVVAENWDGTTYQEDGVETLSMYNDEGGVETFVHESLVAEPVEATVELDFSGGDMIVTPENGQTFSSILIPKPPNLIPENVPKDMDMAGIIGAMKVGGECVYATGTFTGMTDSEIVVEHNLGVIPDIVVILTKNKTTSPTQICLQQFMGVSSAFYEKIGSCFSCFFTALRFYSSSNSYYASVSQNVTSDTGCIDTGRAAVARVRNANEESFTILNGANGWYIDSDLEYSWFAIGGLT